MKIAYLFPGQGSQIIGMGKDFYDAFPTARNLFEQADQALNIPLSRLCFEGPQSELNLTEYTQPAILTVSMAIAGVLQEKAPSTFIGYTAGHSLGEYSAHCFAGSFPFESAVRLVNLRGKAMQEATPPGVGSMAAIIGLSKEVVIDICRAAANTQVLEAANFNAPDQVVISGHIEAVTRAVGMAKEKGAKRSVILPVSAPFHCSLMKPAELVMAAELTKTPIQPPVIPIVNNADASRLEPSETRIRDSLIRQITSPVEWNQTIQYMLQTGVDLFVEIGPGRVLTNLAKRIAPNIDRFSIGDIDSMNQYIEHLKKGC